MDVDARATGSKAIAPAVERTVELGAKENDNPGDVEPNHQNDHSTDRAVDTVV